MAKGALKFKNMTVAKQPQELGRFRVLGGPEAGSLFVITSPRVSIGRGEENEIVVVDLKMSRRHAEVLQTPQGLLIRDLGSANGIAINGQVLKQWYLKTGDKIGIGSSVLEFMSPESGTQMLTMPPSTVTPNVGGANSGLTQFLKLVPNGTQAGAPGSPGGTATGTSGDANNLLERNKKLVFIIAGLVAVSIMIPQLEFQVKKKRRGYKAPAELQGSGSNLSKYLPQTGDEESKRKADLYYKEGYREFTEKNYLRARASFEVALQIFPGHEGARLYVENTLRAMEEEAKSLKKLAKKDEEANRLNSALHRYDAVRRMYFKDQSNPIYKEADEAYRNVEKKLKETQ